MKHIVGTSFALVLLAGSAAAQTPPPPPAPPAPHSDADRPMVDEPHPEGPRAARFRIRVGDVMLGVTCPEDEALKACSDFAMQLLDKAQSMQKH